MFIIKKKILSFTAIIAILLSSSLYLGGHRLHAASSPYVYETHFLDYIQVSGEYETYTYGTRIGGFPYSTKQALIYYADYAILDALFVNVNYVLFDGVTYYPYLFLDSTLREVSFLDSKFTVKFVLPVVDFVDIVVPSDYLSSIDIAFAKGQESGYTMGYANARYDFGYYDSVADTTLTAFDYGELQHQLGYDTGYTDGLHNAEHIEGSFGGLLSYVLKPFELLSLEIFPNITIGTIVLIPIVFGLIKFIFSLRGK